MRGLSVIIPSKTASSLVPCVQAIRKNEPSSPIIVIDDGLDMSAENAQSRDRCWGCDVDPVIIIKGISPFIFSRNCNLGISEARHGEDILILNDDALLQTPGGFTAMQRLAEEHPAYGLIGPLTNVSGNREQLQEAGTGLRETARTLPFLCVLIPRRTIEKVGLLDERFTAYGWEDNDYCKRVRDAGLKVGIFEGCFVDHGSLTSTFRGHANNAGDIEPGRKIFEEKWGKVCA